jgi:hypothetical protein
MSRRLCSFLLALVLEEEKHRWHYLEVLAYVAWVVWGWVEEEAWERYGSSAHSDI